MPRPRDRQDPAETAGAAGPTEHDRAEPASPSPVPTITPRDRVEQGALLRLVFALGATVSVGIVFFFGVGVWIGRVSGWERLGPLAGLLLGLGLSFYWAWLRIAAHLRAFPPPTRSRRDRSGEDAAKH